jgi:hypothetical protein
VDAVTLQEDAELADGGFRRERRTTFTEGVDDCEVTAAFVMRNSESEAVGAAPTRIDESVIPDIPRRGMFPHASTDTGLDSFPQDERFQIGPEASAVLGGSRSRVTLSGTIHHTLG